MKLLSSLIFLLILGCSQFGETPSEDDKKNFKSSKSFNSKEGVFQNRRPNLISKMKEENFNLQLVLDWFSSGEDRVPNKNLPEIKPDLTSFNKDLKRSKVIWFGHSSFLLSMSGKTILVDPIFSDSASPFSFMVKRFQKPVLSLKELPKINFILISHDHYDHLDMDTVKFFKDQDVKFITPLGVGSHLRSWGIKKQNIIERDWWESAQFDDIKFTATPAQHFSGRDGINDNSTLWASWVIKDANSNIYFSGDSGYDTHFKDIGDRLGPFDIAFMESGQYDSRWYAVHLLPKHFAQAFSDINAKKYFPVHWGMFHLAFHPWYEPIENLFELHKQKKVELIMPKLGEVVTIGFESSVESWWR